MLQHLYNQIKFVILYKYKFQTVRRLLLITHTLYTALIIHKQFNFLEKSMRRLCWSCWRTMTTCCSLFHWSAIDMLFIQSIFRKKSFLNNLLTCVRAKLVNICLECDNPDSIILLFNGGNTLFSSNHYSCRLLMRWIYNFSCGLQADDSHYVINLLHDALAYLLLFIELKILEVKGFDMKG